ncbi:hypothetical protein V0288_05355 [Pannus brasiliensis CCIBt3594]|uniref:Uncharacterized protein n=1 Tax=Pannus brasiliensis CCIBt3594 TaxID=1427578 RepID=A0AAW9QUF3_9CHRO
MSQSTASKRRSAIARAVLCNQRAKSLSYKVRSIALRDSATLDLSWNAKIVVWLGRQESGDGRRRQETGDGDRRQETGDRRQERIFRIKT